MITQSLQSSEIFWVTGTAECLPLHCSAKVRYRQPDQDCTVIAHADGFRVDFEEPQRAITPGQSVVFYQGDECLGGAIIEAAL